MLGIGINTFVAVDDVPSNMTTDDLEDEARRSII